MGDGGPLVSMQPDCRREDSRTDGDNFAILGILKGQTGFRRPKHIPNPYTIALLSSAGKGNPMLNVPSPIDIFIPH